MGGLGDGLGSCSTTFLGLGSSLGAALGGVDTGSALLLKSFASLSACPAWSKRRTKGREIRSCPLGRFLATVRASRKAPRSKTLDPP